MDSIQNYCLTITANMIPLQDIAPDIIMHVADTGALSQYKDRFSGYGDSHFKDKTVFNMAIPILVRHLYIETAPKELALLTRFPV